jgi:hypothetical protein
VIFFFHLFLEESLKEEGREKECPNKNEVRSITRGYFQNQFRVPAYKHVGRPTQDSQKRDEDLDKVTNVFMEQYTLPTDTNELPNLPTRNDVETWSLTNDEDVTLRSENDWSIDLQSHTVTADTHDDDDTVVVDDDETYETHYGAHARFVTYAEHTDPKYPRKERTSLEKNGRGRETLEIQITGDRGCGLR